MQLLGFVGHLLGFELSAKSLHFGAEISVLGVWQRGCGRGWDRSRVGGRCSHLKKKNPFANHTYLKSFAKNYCLVQ